MTEEQKLIFEIERQKEILIFCRNDVAVSQRKKNEAEQRVEWAENALLKYMNDTGQIAFECGEVKVSIRESEQVDIASLDAVPEEYVRVKEVREPNKALIKAIKPKGNWYCLKTCQNINIKLKG